MGLCGGAQSAWGQGRTFGNYAATVKLAGTEVDGETRRVVYRAEVKMNIPVNDGNPSRAISFRHHKFGWVFVYRPPGRA
jgi:hypothetical protein